MATARAILERGDCVVVFPEGTRVRPGPLGAPRRGVGRLALETGAPVAPVAVIGTEDVRSGWRIRPRKVRLRVGRAAAVPERRALLARARRRGHRAHLGVREPAVGLARRRRGGAARTREPRPQAHGVAAAREEARARADSQRGPPRRRRPGRSAKAGDRVCDE